MWGEISKIEEVKNSRNVGNKFIRVHFKLENGKWAKTDLVPGFRNFRRWKRLLKIGNVIGNIRLKNKDTVDADSFVFLFIGDKVKDEHKLAEEEMMKMGVFG